MEVVMARGPNFVYAKEFINETYGTSMWNNVLDALPGNASELWKGPMLVTKTYPFDIFKTTMKILSEQLGNMAEEETARVYEYIAERSLNSVYKIFFVLPTRRL